MTHAAVVIALLSVAPPMFAQTFGLPPGYDVGAEAAAITTQQPQARSFIVIPIYHASPLLIAYAVQADDVIWDDGGSGGGSGYGTTGRGQSTTSGQQSYSSGRGGSSYSGRGSGGQRGRSR